MGLYSRVWWVLLVVCAAAAPISADPPTLADNDEGAEAPPVAEVTEFVVSPAAAPTPMLKWRLRPGPLDLKPGDAGPLYGKAVLLEDSRTDEDRETICEAQDATPDGMEGALKLLGRDETRQILELLDSAALKEHWTRQAIEWDEEHPEAFPERENFLRLGRLMAVRARSDIAVGRTEDAIRGLRTAYALSAGLVEYDEVLSLLTGLAVRAAADSQLRYLIQQPDAPNMYWALAELPSAYSATPGPVEVELHQLFHLVPEFAEPQKKLRTVEDWNRTTASFFEPPMQVSDPAVGSAAMLMKLASPATEHMAKHRGMTPVQLKDMPATVVVGTYIHDLIASRADRAVAAFRLPYPEAAPRLAKMDKEATREDMNMAEGLAAIMLVDLSEFAYAAACADRRTAALMCVEALRMHAAAEGRLPESLRDVTVVPVPKDPMAGKPFVYSLDGEVATLRASEEIVDEPLSRKPNYQINYRIRLRK